MYVCMCVCVYVCVQVTVMTLDKVAFHKLLGPLQEVTLTLTLTLTLIEYNTFPELVHLLTYSLLLFACLLCAYLVFTLLSCCAIV